MHVVMLHGPRDVRLDEEPAFQGEPGPHEVLVRTVATAISTGTEMAAVTAKHGTSFYGWPFDYPSNLGYLNVGRAVAVGAAVADITPGDLLYTFRQHREEFLFPGADPHWHVPAGLDPAVAAFAYLISLGAHGLRRAGLVPGERVAVVGLGAVGLGAVAMARQFGSTVTAIDPVGLRRDLAVALGADAVLDPRSGDMTGIDADVVLEAAGTWPAVRTALEAVRYQGRIAIAALHPEAGDVNPLGETFYRKQAAIFSTSFQPTEQLAAHHVRFTLRRGVQDVLDRLASGRLDYSPAVTHRIPYRELPATYAQLADGSLETGAIAVLWP